MPFEVVLPRLGWNMETGQLGEWLKKDGDHVVEGELLFTVEGDKATQEIEALESGILRIPPDSPSPGQEIPVGTLLAYLVAPDELATFSFDVAAQPAVEEEPEAASSGPATGEKATPAISPRARRIARELGVDWTSL
ncbi:MAG: hypothetical protein KDI55_24530, partial [Anaerolineae bacterium]|nr:hypothetical protein [Anaerolineae bacterium]